MLILPQRSSPTEQVQMSAQTMCRIPTQLRTIGPYLGQATWLGTKMGLTDLITVTVLTCSWVQMHRTYSVWKEWLQSGGCAPATKVPPRNDSSQNGREVGNFSNVPENKYSEKGKRCKEEKTGKWRKAKKIQVKPRQWRTIRNKR